MPGLMRKRMKAGLAAAMLMLGLSACELNQSTADRTLTGAAVGAAGGAAVGLITGDFLGRAATGAAAGAAGGFVYDQLKKNQ